MRAGQGHTRIDIIKPLRWIGSARRDLAAFPEHARRMAGFELFAVQQDRQPSDFKPMPTIGAGVYEIRVHMQTEHRVFYLAKFPEAVYVLHTFEKRTRKTAARDLNLGRRRFTEMIKLRAAEGRR